MEIVLLGYLQRNSLGQFYVFIQCEYWYRFCQMGQLLCEMIRDQFVFSYIILYVLYVCLYDQLEPFCVFIQFEYKQVPLSAYHIYRRTWILAFSVKIRTVYHSNINSDRINWNLRNEKLVFHISLNSNLGTWDLELWTAAAISWEQIKDANIANSSFNQGNKYQSNIKLLKCHATEMISIGL